MGQIKLKEIERMTDSVARNCKDIGKSESTRR